MRCAFCVVLLAVGLLSACSSSSKEVTADQVLLVSDFENLAGWGGLQSPSLTRERAHSGQYSIKTDATLEYSLTFSDVLARLPAGPLTKIRVSAWVFAPAPGGAHLMVQFTRTLQDNTPVFDGSIALSPAGKKRGEWVYLSQVFDLPTTLSPANQLRVFVWRASASEPLYVDDLVIAREP